MSIRSPEPRSTSPDGAGNARRLPGLGEAWLWTVGYQLIQLIVLALLGSLLLWLACTDFPPTLEEVVRIIDELGWESSLLFTGTATLAALFVIVPLVRLRVGCSLRAEFGMQRLDWPQLLAISAAVVPLALLSDELYRWGVGWTRLLAEFFPVLQPLASLDAIQVVQRQSDSAAYPVLFVAIALGPALGEELVFRGLISGGLIPRYGIAAGTAVTTLLFALAHGSPAHALATIPIGLFLQYVYQTTRNLWAPILLHCLLNGLAVTLMRFGSAGVSGSHPAVVCASLGYLIVVGALLWGRHSAIAGGSFSGSGSRLSPTFPAVASCSILAYTGVFVWTMLP